ncbi:MAG: hypothetical protein P1P84_01410 [Deferrisomatales bacterium]|nr:hypothetical protein [Deferrisomatales bacterium]
MISKVLTLGLAALTVLLLGAADSPLVDAEGSATQRLAGAAVTYTF